MYKIKGISFSILSPGLVKSLAVVRMVTSELYDIDGYPVEGGVMDPRLGVIDPGLNCRTCGGSIGDCPGHFGYLELARPVTHILYTKAIYRLLKITCRKCGRVMSKEVISLAELFKNPPQTCPYCSEKQGKISFVKSYTFYEDKEELDPGEIRERFEKIPDEDLIKIGFKGGRPEWLILTLFPIPPVTMRPSITLETGERSEDDLTHKLVDIVRINQSLRENIDIGAPEFILNDLWELLQYHIATYFDNELTGIPQARHRSGRPLKGIVQRLKGKEGRIRGNLLGKRVNFSARTVISPDPRISINEVGVPEVIAKELTIEECVTSLNLKQAKDLIKLDKVNYVSRPDGRRIKVTQENKKEILENITLDWGINRQLRDGDIVLFNRQPSLHRPSIMVHKVKIMPYRTFRIAPQVCPPYNADFDGDEMNLHVPQSEEARMEAHEIMSVENNIVSPRFGGPLIGLDLDQISGIYLLTKDGVSLSGAQVSQLLGAANIELDLPNKSKFTGKEVFSLLLPPKLSLEFKANYGGMVKIKNGKLLRGSIDAAAVGAFKGKIISKLHRLVSNEKVKEFIDKGGRLGEAFLMSRGFSMGVSDLDLPDKIKIKVKRIILKAEKESNRLVERYNKGKLRILPGLTPTESLETHILNILADALNDISNQVERSIKYNDVIVMAESGAKGSLINTTQMSACVGQEAILGQRIKRGYLYRTLPHFEQRDLSAEAHGFVARGFKQGLTPTELFWNVMNGREGLMDKSLRTRKSGYMQRRLVNALQDLRVEHDRTVRSSSGQIIQFIAGEDGIDPSKSDWGRLKWED